MKKHFLTFAIGCLCLLILIAFVKRDLLYEKWINIVKRDPYVISLLQKNAQLEKELQSKVTVTQERVIIKWRDKVQVKEIVVEKPVEGKVEVLQSSTSYQPNMITSLTHDTFISSETNTVVLVQKMGLTFLPQISMVYSLFGDISPNVDVRFAYWRNYGMVMMGFPIVGIAVDRRLHDYVFFLKNTTFGVFYGYSLIDKSYQFGLRVGVFL